VKTPVRTVPKGKPPRGLAAVQRDSWFVGIRGVRQSRRSRAGRDAKAGLRRISGMQIDEGDSRLLEPGTERIIGCAFRVANPQMLRV
jgi:hypothetical protein